MSEMEQARKAGGSGKPFTTAVVLAVIICNLHRAVCLAIPPLKSWIDLLRRMRSREEIRGDHRALF